MRVPKWDAPKGLELFSSRITFRTGHPILSLGGSSSPRPQERACSQGQPGTHGDPLASPTHSTLGHRMERLLKELGTYLLVQGGPSQDEGKGSSLGPSLLLRANS